jgi:hypothetical protein
MTPAPPTPLPCHQDPEWLVRLRATREAVRPEELPEALADTQVISSAPHEAVASLAPVP